MDKTKRCMPCPNWEAHPRKKKKPKKHDSKSVFPNSGTLTELDKRYRTEREARLLRVSPKDQYPSFEQEIRTDRTTGLRYVVNIIKGGKYHNEELTADHPLVAELGLCTTKESY